MKTLLLSIFAASLFSCCSQKVQKTNEDSTTTSTTARNQNLPNCIKKLIKDFETEGVQNPPRKIYSYTFRDSTVYYVTAVCCDNFSDLYNNKCNLMAHPDGGFTGRGDGKIKDFKSQATNEQLVWQDTRTFK